MNFFDRLWNMYDSLAYAVDWAEHGKKVAQSSRELRNVAFFSSPEEHKANRALTVFRKAASDRSGSGE